MTATFKAGEPIKFTLSQGEVTVRGTATGMQAATSYNEYHSIELNDVKFATATKTEFTATHKVTVTMPGKLQLDAIRKAAVFAGVDPETPFEVASINNVQYIIFSWETP